MGQFPVLEPVRLVGGGAEASMAVFLVCLVVAFKPQDLAVAFEGENVRRDAIEEPAIVADHHRTAAEIHERFFQCSQRINVEIVRWFIEQDQVAARPKQLGKMHTVPLATRALADFPLLIGPAEIEPRHITAASDFFFPNIM